MAWLLLQNFSAQLTTYYRYPASLRVVMFDTFNSIILSFTRLLFINNKLRGRRNLSFFQSNSSLHCSIDLRVINNDFKRQPRIRRGQIDTIDQAMEK